jgi:hypothetical protein
VVLETKPDGTPDPESPHVSTLLERIPQLNLEDEEGILLIQLKPVEIGIDNYEISHIDYHTIYLPIECIQRVIPLTERAGRILEPRMGSFRVIISPSYFDKQVRETWFRLGLRKALRGGDVLVKALFKDGLKIIDETLRKAVEFGICELDYQDCSMEDLEGKNITWIAEAFKYSRREPFKFGDLNYILDAGVVLKKSIGEENSQLLGPLREVVEDAHKKIDKIGSMVGFFNHSQWNQSISKMEESNLLGTTPAGFTSLVLFLRWKERFHKMNQKVDFSQLDEDASEFAGSINFENTVSAVWMFGCFVGYENVTQEVYTGEKYSFSSSTEPHFTEKISKPEKTITPDPSIPKDTTKAEADSTKKVKKPVSAADATPGTDTVEVTEDATKAVADSAKDVKESVSAADASPGTDTVEVTEDATKAVADSAKDVKESLSTEVTPSPEAEAEKVLEDVTKAVEDSAEEAAKIAREPAEAKRLVEEQARIAEQQAQEEAARKEEERVAKEMAATKDAAAKILAEKNRKAEAAVKKTAGESGTKSKKKQKKETDSKNQGVQTTSESESSDETEEDVTDETSGPNKDSGESQRVSSQQIKAGREELFEQNDLFENDQKDSNSGKK